MHVDVGIPRVASQIMSNNYAECHTLPVVAKSRIYEARPGTVTQMACNVEETFY